MSNGKKEKIHSYSNSTDDYIHKIQKNDVNLREDSVALNGGLFSLLNVPRKIARLRVSFFGSQSIGYWKVWWVAFTQFAVQQRNNPMTRISTFFRAQNWVEVFCHQIFLTFSCHSHPKLKFSFISFRIV